MTIRTVVIDDEPLARERIISLLGQYDDIEIVGAYGSGAEALRSIAGAAPDALFLDIHMPGIDGFSFLEALKEDARPAVVFVTAYDEHAVRAFEVNALDYLLKPFTHERFDRAMQRLRETVSRKTDGDYRERLSRALDSVQSARSKRVPVKTENGTYLIPVEQIEWAQAEGNYIRLHTESGSPRIRETMEAFCERLPAGVFLRIHRSIVVNLERIVRAEPWAHGEYVVIMRGGTKLKSGRAYSESLRALLH